MDKIPCCKTSYITGLGTRGMCIQFCSGSMKGRKDLVEIGDLCLDGRIILKCLLKTPGAKVYIDQAAGQVLIYRSVTLGARFQIQASLYNVCGRPLGSESDFSECVGFLQSVSFSQR
jgi:hypothetical protein